MRRFGSRLAVTVLAVALLVSLAGRITYADDGTVTPTLDPVPIVDPTVDSTIVPTPTDFPDDPEGWQLP